MRSNYQLSDLAQTRSWGCPSRSTVKNRWRRSMVTEPRFSLTLPTSPRFPEFGSDSPDSDRRGSRAWLADAQGRTFPILQQMRLGRSLENDCLLPDQGVSRHHAAIRRDRSGACWLFDMDSVNGTFLNGPRVEGSSLLHHGDRIRIGRFDFSFHQPAGANSNEDPETSSLLGESYRREARWMLLTDIVQATAILQQNGTQSYQARLGRWLRNSQWIVNHYCGSIHEFIGDGLFAYWPDAAGIETEVLGALRALRVTEMASAFEFRMVLHRGDVRIAERGSVHRAGLCGESIHYLFRLEKVAERLNCHNLLSKEAGIRLLTSLPGLTPVDCDVPDFGNRCVYTLPSEAWGRRAGCQPRAAL